MAIRPSQMTHHKQIEVTYPFTGELISVDEGIATILELMWESGVQTEFSCEGDPWNFAYVAYRASGDRAIRRVIHSMALPYVRWSRYDSCAHLRDGGPVWAVYWAWDWTVIAQVESVLELRK